MRKSFLQNTAISPQNEPGRTVVRPGARAGTRMNRREPDDTDYDQRHFVNLLAAAFLLGLGLCTGVTIKMFEHQQKLEKCLISGRKDCIEVTQGAPRGMVVLSRHANR